MINKIRAYAEWTEKILDDTEQPMLLAVGKMILFIMPPLAALFFLVAATVLLAGQAAWLALKALWLL